jgi:nucleoside phosphorylase
VCAVSRACDWTDSFYTHIHQRMAAKGSERIVVIVCACSEDADEVRTIFARNKTPLEADFSNPSLAAWHATMPTPNGECSIILVSAFDKGPSRMYDCMSTLTRDARCAKACLILLVGACAGLKGSIALGDVVVATKAFNYEVDAVRFYTPAEHLVTYLRTITEKDRQLWVVPPSDITLPAREIVLRYIYESNKAAADRDTVWFAGYGFTGTGPLFLDLRKCIPDVGVVFGSLEQHGEVCAIKGKMRVSDEVVAEIESALAQAGDYPAHLRPQSLVHFGVCASGSMVRADTIQNGNANSDKPCKRTSKVFAECLKQDRETIATDMETFAFYLMANSHFSHASILSIKGVTNFADADKNDCATTFAKRQAAAFAYHALTCLLADDVL